MTGFWGEPYGVPAPPWDTFGGPAPQPALEQRVSVGPAEWRPGVWKPVPDARSLANILREMNDGTNFYGFELRRAVQP